MTNTPTEANTRDLILYALFRLLVNALGIALIARVLPGIIVTDNSIGTYIIIGLTFGIINALLKPILTILTCSLVVFTFGLFLLVINGLILYITAGLLGDLFIIDNLGWAILGSIMISLINMVLEGIIGDDDGTGKRIRITRSG